jgi:hypothetical protein
MAAEVPDDDVFLFGDERAAVLECEVDCNGGMAAEVPDDDVLLFGDELNRGCLLRALSRRANIISLLVFIGSVARFSLPDSDATAACGCLSCCTAVSSPV